MYDDATQLNGTVRTLVQLQKEDFASLRAGAIAAAFVEANRVAQGEKFGVCQAATMNPGELALDSACSHTVTADKSALIGLDENVPSIRLGTAKDNVFIWTGICFLSKRCRNQSDGEVVHILVPAFYVPDLPDCIHDGLLSVGMLEKYGLYFDNRRRVLFNRDNTMTFEFQGRDPATHSGFLYNWRSDAEGEPVKQILRLDFSHDVDSNLKYSPDGGVVASLTADVASDGAPASQGSGRPEADAAMGFAQRDRSRAICDLLSKG